MTILRVTRREFVAAVGCAAAWPLAVACMLLWPSIAFPHDIYGTLTNGQGVSCCGGHDCRPADYRIKADAVEMLVEGRWIVVPTETIDYRTLNGDNGETGGGHWCGVTDDFVAVTFCAILPPSSTLLTERVENSRGRPLSSPELPQ